MPIPKLEFEDADAGLPRQPVPVRFACMAADWSPALFADLVTGDEQLGPPLLTVWQYDEQNERVGRIPPQAYGDLIPRDARLAEALSGIPANHFVWSDELSIAFSQLIDLTIGREVANEAQLEIRWDTAIDKDCARKVAEGPDFSKIFAPSRKDCYLKKVGGAWITSYDGIETPIKHSIGLVYLQYLLAHPYRDVPVNDLNTCSYPPAGADIQNAADYESDADSPNGFQRPQDIDERPASKEADEYDVGVDEQVMTWGPIGADDSKVEEEITDEQEIDTFDERGVRIKASAGSGIKIFDNYAIDSIKRHIARLDTAIKKAKKEGKTSKAKKLKVERANIAKHLKAGRNFRGKSRILGDTNEQKRKRIGNAILRAREHIAAVHPVLGKHLKKSIRTGYVCEYTPSETVKWV